MVNTTVSIRRLLKLTGLALALTMTAAPAWAAPGDPLGGDHTGCAAADGCARKAEAALAKLRLRLVGCHMSQVNKAFGEGMSTPEIQTAEEDCEAAAKGKFDDIIAGLSGCDSTLISNANARRDVILSDQTVSGSVDNLNGRFYCDATSGNLINPGGDDGGYIPSSENHLKCGNVVAKAWGALNVALVRCHYRLALAVFKDKPYDSSVCEVSGGRSAADKYYRKIIRFVDAGVCPPCLADSMNPTNAFDLGPESVTDADDNLGELYLCPAP